VRNMESDARMNSRSSFTGFTIIELMVSIAIVAILVGIGVPSFQTAIQNARLSASISDLQAAMLNARSEAMKRNSPVVVAPIDGASWTSGWRTVVTPTVGATEELQLRPQLAIVISVDSSTGTGFSTGSGTGIRYDGQGFARDASGAFSASCLTLKVPTGRRTSLVVGASGRPRACNPDRDAGCCVSNGS
jgi:type IV fimbrial biogenesis protein FimT